jgi:hypothetical protein
MGCPGECVLGDNLVFDITTHDADTAVLTDADELPTYRIYEENSDTAMLTGSMEKRDDPNTTGRYKKSIAFTTGNGFSAGKTYSILITGVVGGDTGGITYTVKGIAALEGANSVTVTVQEADTTPISDASVTIRNSDETLVVGTGVTDSLGQLAVSLPDGTYKLRFAKVGFNFTNPQTLVVDGIETLTVTGTPISVPSPGSGLQLFSGYIVNIIGEFDTDVSVSATRLTSNQYVDPYVISNEVLTDTVDASGYFSLQLMKGAKVIVKLMRDSDVMDEKSFLVSSEDTADWNDY